MKKALIFGITGQDGSYLAELLVEKGYEVHGLVRRSSSFNLYRIEQLVNSNKITVHYGDLSDGCRLFNLIKAVKPDEVYNLAAQSQVYTSFDNPEYTSDINALGVLRILEALRATGVEAKYFNAVSSEIFGSSSEVPQKETTPLNAETPYGAAKLYAYNITKIYREKYQMFNASGILYNHESPRRSENFVTRKITKAIANIVVKQQNELCLGNIYGIGDTRRIMLKQCGLCFSRTAPTII
jgi:GDPmannose 4,6-dehydratase